VKIVVEEAEVVYIFFLNKLVSKFLTITGSYLEAKLSHLEVCLFYHMDHLLVIYVTFTNK
jgi:hypothetical protein